MLVQSFTRRFALVVFVLPALVLAGGSDTEMADAYKRADSLRSLYESHAYNIRLEPHWYADGAHFWFRKELGDGKAEFEKVDCSTGNQAPAFDQSKLAAKLSQATNRAILKDKLPFATFRFADDEKAIEFVADGKGWKYTLDTDTLGAGTPPEGPPRRGRGGAAVTTDVHPADRTNRASPNGDWTAHIVGTDVWVKSKDGTDFQLTKSGSEDAYFARLIWSPDGQKIIATRVHPGDRKTVSFVESSPAVGGTRGILHTRMYDQPGDKVDSYDLWILDPAKKEAKQIQGEAIDYGEWPQIRFRKDPSHFTYEKMDRGYSRWRLFDVDTADGSSKTILDDHPSTFVDSTSQFIWFAKDSDQMVWRSEQSGWGQLYLADPDGTLHPITKGEWVVREVERVDEQARTITFSASGKESGEDPYFIHFYRVNFDGSGLIDLTPAPGTHLAVFSPKRDYLVDTYSSANTPPVHELRRVSDGSLVSKLSSGDISELKKLGWQTPEPFVAKGRDGKTDIWGIVYRPSNFNPRSKYPVIENIYAGPHDSFVPKPFAAWRSMASLAELGFIVVQIDGMGTRNRGKAFQDVCFKNLADAGFPDRILWMKALAQKYRYVDISRVGVYGTSAGGQESTAAMLFHPEFYKVAVSSCGCHDNRIDKIWWNEQWMGYPVGKEYDDDSNITNAAKLQGKLMLYVGEMDTNVPPESTLKLVNALIKAGKDFEMLVIPGSDHTDGGPYGERKRRDFFVKNLLGKQPPNWNGPK